MPNSSNNRLSETSELDQRIHKALDAAKMALWEFDITNGTIQWTGKVSPHFYELAASVDGTLANYIERIHPDDIDLVLSVIQESVVGKGFLNQHRVLFPDGKYHWLEGIGNVFMGEDSIKMMGAVQDITDKKELEFEREEWKRKHDLVAASTGILVYDHDLVRQITKWNGDVKKVLGYTEKDLEKEDFWELKMHPDDLEMIRPFTEVAQKNITSFDIVYRFKTKSGSYRHVRDKGIFYGEKETGANRVLGMIEDVHERRKYEDSLKESEARFKSMIHDMQIGIALYDVKTRPIVWNTQAYELHGMTEDEFMGKAALGAGWKVLNEEGFQVNERDFPIPKCIRLKRPVNGVVLRVYRPTLRSWIWLRVDAEPIYDMDGRFRHVICTFSDVSELQKSKRILREKNELLSTLASELKGRNERLLEFAQIVSHNLRSPISSIVALLKLMEGATEETKERALSHISEVSNRALLTIEELNNVLKVQHENVKSERLDFNCVIDDIISSHRGQIVESAAVIKRVFHAERITYPKIYLESIFLNLLTNSIKYRSKERRCEIIVETYKDKRGDLILNWTDNGVGIDLDKYRNDIFQMGKTFHQIKDSRGIGLFLIKSQINAVGGTIDVSSQLGVGTTFTINFKKQKQREKGSGSIDR